MHEFVLSARSQKKASGGRALALAQALVDYGIHPRTVYFPLIADGAMPIRPTESASAACPCRSSFCEPLSLPAPAALGVSRICSASLGCSDMAVPLLVAVR